MEVGDSTADELSTVRGDPPAIDPIDGTTDQIDQGTIEWALADGLGFAASGDVGAESSRRFRRLRLHSRGGLGAVFVALDTELNREVALKQILDRHAQNPASRSRFLVEAEITGWLEHPGVAPVYSLGIDEKGQPFYAMRFIRGETLREAIDRFHAPGPARDDPGRRSLGLQKLLRRFLDVCNTIEFAHSRGVIHRDIKPSNVVVGTHGETLVVDWGLAKFIGKEDAPAGDDPGAEDTPRPPDREDRHETAAGMALGTPAFMSPEQAEGRGDAVGFASDVYSLGATLYYLLTGQTPVSRGFVPDALQKLQRGEFPPGQVNRLAPAALAAVILKAMALEPTDRYDSARALAEDIEHWLAAEPVSCYREPISGRARRWWRRHPRLTGGAAAAVVVALATLAGSTFVLRQYSSSEALARSQAESRLILAIESVAEFGSRFTDDPRIRARGLETFRRDLLLRARDFYRKIASDLKGGNDPRLKAESGRIYLQIARISLELEHHEEARAAAAQAIKVFDLLRGEKPQDPSFAEGLARCKECLGRVDIREYRYGRARLAFQEAESIWDGLRRSHPEVRSYRLGQVGSLTALGKVLRFQEDFPSAEATLRRGLGLCSGDEPDSQEAKADVLEHLGEVQEAWALESPRDSASFSTWLEAARGNLAASFELRWRLEEQSPGDPEVRLRTIQNFLQFATACWNGRHPGPAEVRLMDVRARAADLVREHSDVPYYKGLLAYCDAIRALFLECHGQHEGAIELANAAVVEAPTYPQSIFLAAIALCSAAEAAPPGGEVATVRLLRAMDLLRTCGDLGFFRNRLIVRELRSGHDLRILRDREDFRSLLDAVEADGGAQK